MIKTDVLVVGGGHAGLEAALAAARLGAKCILLTQDIETIGTLACNPAFGGPAKGGLVREVDALGGFCGQMADLSAKQCRILGESKGPAARSTRMLLDRHIYRKGAKEKVLNQANLTVLEGEAGSIIAKDGCASSVKLVDGREINAGAIVLCGGTFWRAKIHRGRQSVSAGRLNEKASNIISTSLENLGHRLGRLSTCTPARIEASSVDISSLEIQAGQDVRPFSSLNDHVTNTAVCWLSWTTPESHQIVANGLKDSIFHSDQSRGTPPRYCPSIEDKIFHYPQRERHHVFLEPDVDGHIFPSGIPSGLDPLVQLAMIQTMPGLEKAKLAWPGYAIEYDYADPSQLNAALESLYVKNLFLAGQINGTSGYEEAAAQGLLAGVNASLAAGGNRNFLILSRSRSLSGVMIDDLTGRGISEPYRMFTSRAEWRLLLREDNADLRLSALAEDLGLLDSERSKRFHKKIEDMEKGRELLYSKRISPQESRELQPPSLELKEAQRASDLLKRPAAKLSDFIPLIPALAELGPTAADSLEVEIKFEGYIKRQEEEVARLSKEEDLRIPQSLDFMKLSGLSTEVKEVLTRHRPGTLGQAKRLPGITPAALTVLAIQIKK